MALCSFRRCGWRATIVYDGVNVIYGRVGNLGTRALRLRGGFLKLGRTKTRTYVKKIVGFRAFSDSSRVPERFRRKFTTAKRPPVDQIAPLPPVHVEPHAATYKGNAHETVRGPDGRIIKRFYACWKHSGNFRSEFDNFGTNSAAARFIPKTCEKISAHEPIDMRPQRRRRLLCL